MHLQVDVGHDGQDERDRWHLEWVRVTNLTTGETATFNCNRWGVCGLCRGQHILVQALLQHQHLLCPPAWLPFPRLLEWLFRALSLRRHDCLHIGQGRVQQMLDSHDGWARSTECPIHCCVACRWVDRLNGPEVVKVLHSAAGVVDALGSTHARQDFGVSRQQAWEQTYCLGRAQQQLQAPSIYAC